MIMPQNFDPNALPADKCSVKLYIGRSTAYLFGTLIRSFMHLKENIFGEDQHFTPMDSDYSGINTPVGGVVGSSGPSKSAMASKTDNESCTTQVEVWDPRLYRPIEVVLDLSVNNLQVRLIFPFFLDLIQK